MEWLRVYAFMGVILSHTNIIDIGRQGVSIFFLLTGFLLTYHYYDKDISLSIKNMLSFSYKRIMKLYPLYICTLIVLVPISGWEFEVENFKNLLIHIFLLQSLFEREVMVLYNGPAWYLSCMMFIYLLMPIIIVFVKKYRNKAEPVIVSVILFILQILIDETTYVYGYAFPLSRVIDVIIGCNIGFLFMNRKNSIYSKLQYTLVEVLAIAFALISESLYLCIGNNNYEIFIPSSIILVYVFAINKGYLSKILSNELFKYLGSISSYIFLIHIVTVNYLNVVARFIFHTEINNVLMFILSLVLTLICAEVWKWLSDEIKGKFMNLCQG